MPRVREWKIDLGTPGVDAPDTGGDLNWSPKENWVDKVGGLPRYIDRIAGDVMTSGHDRTAAIKIAIGQVRNWCHDQGNVHPEGSRGRLP